MSTSVASVVSHFPDAENGFTTTLASTISSGAATVPLNSVAGYTNGMPVVFVVDPSDATKKQTFTGIIDTAGVQVTSVVWTAGTNQSHSGGATVVDYATATHIAMITKGLLVSFDQDGTPKAGAIDNAAALASDVVTTAKILDGNVTTAKLADSAVTPAKLLAGTGTTWAWQSWTPTWANLTIGNATVEAKYSIMGKTVRFKLVATLGSSSSVGTSPTFTLPVTSATVSVANAYIGASRLKDANGDTNPGAVLHGTTTTAGLIAYDSNGTFPRESGITSTNPFTWASGDIIFANGEFEMA